MTPLRAFSKALGHGRLLLEAVCEFGGLVCPATEDIGSSVGSSVGMSSGCMSRRSCTPGVGGREIAVSKDQDCGVLLQNVLQTEQMWVWLQ